MVPKPKMDYTKNDTKEVLLSDGVQKIIIIKQESNSNSNRPVIGIVDILLSIFVVTPLVVCAWRGAWGLMDLYPNYFPLFSSVVVGIVLHIVFALCQDTFHKTIVESEKHWTLKIVSHFLRRFYTYLFFIVTILHWRGFWGLLDYYLNISFTENSVTKWEGCHWMLIVWAVSLVILLFMRSIRNATAPPFAICLDKGEFVFRFPTMFNYKSDENIWLYMLDCMVSILIPGNLVVIFWKGMWVLVDVLFFPNSYVWSSWIGLILGIVLIGLVFRLQNCVKNLCTRFTGITKIIIADSYILLSIVGTIFYWRGAWNLLYIYLLPNEVELSCFLTHIVGFTFLVVMGCSNSMLVRGVYKDGKGQNGESVVFPCRYLEVILEQENPGDKSELYKQVSCDNKC